MASLLEMKKKLTPGEFATFLRQKGDIFWWEKGKFWVVTSHQLARSVLTSDAFTCDRSSFFVSRMPDLDLNLIHDFFAVVGKMMVMSDAPEHTQRRRICYDGFTNQTLDQLHPLIEATIARQLDACLKKGSIEVVEDLAKVVPSTILADFFHIPDAERQQFYAWSNNMTQFFGGASQYRNEDGIEVNHSARSLHDYFVDLISKRRKNPQGDFLSILLAHQRAFDLSDEEIISQAIMMLVAGQVTTTDQLCNNLYMLLSTYPNLSSADLLIYDLGVVTDELNRLDPAVTFIFRVTKEDTFIGQQAIPKGAVIFISTHAVNRDSRVFDEPDMCQLSRPNNKQLSYGFGAHYCIGAKLARMEMASSIRQLFTRLPHLRLTENDVALRKHHSLAFSGFERLTLSFG